MALKYKYILKDPLLEVFTTADRNGMSNAEAVVEDFINKINEYNPCAIFWTSDVKHSLSIDQLIRLCNTFINNQSLKKIAYVPTRRPTDKSIQNYALMKRMLAYEVEAEVFYEEEDARDWLAAELDSLPC